MTTIRNSVHDAAMNGDYLCDRKGHFTQLCRTAATPVTASDGNNKGKLIEHKKESYYVIAKMPTGLWGINRVSESNEIKLIFTTNEGREFSVPPSKGWKAAPDVGTLNAEFELIVVNII